MTCKKRMRFCKHLMTRTVGIDLSLTGTGLVVLEDGKLVHSRLIKSTRGGARPKDETERLRSIIKEIVGELGTYKPSMVSIEGLAFMARNTTALVQLAGLNYLLRSTLHDIDIPYIVIAPTSLKKYITTKGNAPKSSMMLEVYKRYDVTFTDDNECDAFALARCAYDFLQDTVDHLPKPQQEVITLLLKQV